MTTPTDVLELAWTRYHEEIVFHARVYRAVQIVVAEAKRAGVELPEMFQGFLTAAAATGLLMNDIFDEQTGEYKYGVAGTQGRDHEGGQRADEDLSGRTDGVDGQRAPGTSEHQAEGGSTEP